MSLASTLTDTKQRLDALLEYANEKTGADDVSIGDAIKTLADGFGGGGECRTEYTFNGLVSSGEETTITIPHSLGKTPDFIAVIPKISITSGNNYWWATTFMSCRTKLTSSVAGNTNYSGAIGSSVFLSADTENIYLKTVSWGQESMNGKTYDVYAY